MFFVSIPAQSAKFKVVFINPGNPDQNTTGDFWSNVTLFMSAAASDLDIELVTYYAYRDHIFMKSIAEQVLIEKPEFVILVNEKDQALPLIKRLTSANVKIFSLLNRISKSDYAQLSKQQQSNIKGSVVPDNFGVGKKLLNGLLSTYNQASNITKPINLLALQGDYSTPASIAREQGLLSALSANNNINLIDSTVANWSSEQAYNKVKGIIKRTPIDIIWAANDPMAFGAKKAISELALSYPVVIGGINWDVENPKYPIALSFGGHVTLGAQAIIMLEGIHTNNLPVEQTNQKLDIFESSISSHHAKFSELLATKSIDEYDFSQFSYSTDKPLIFTIGNLLSTYGL